MLKKTQPYTGLGPLFEYWRHVPTQTKLKYPRALTSNCQKYPSRFEVRYLEQNVTEVEVTFNQNNCGFEH